MVELELWSLSLHAGVNSCFFLSFVKDLRRRGFFLLSLPVT